MPSHAIVSYPLPEPGNDLVGNLRTVHAEGRDTLSTLGQRYAMGIQELQAANPEIQADHLQAWQTIVLPSWYILPPGPRTGIVVNLAEMRLYYYPAHENTVMIAPISVGRTGWETPIATTSVTERVLAPAWHVPESLKQQALSLGTSLPDIMPPGPKNPLGRHALRLELEGYLIHGTNDPTSIGQQNSAGCIRLYPDDIEFLFYEVPVGTPVRIINQAYKAGWQGEEFYVEAHLPVGEASSPMPNYQQMIQQKNPTGMVDWLRVQTVSEEAKGYPEPVNIVQAS